MIYTNMFLDKPEDITFFNKIMEDNPNLEPYFAEISTWAWLHHKDKYLELIEECKTEQLNEAIKNNMKFEELNTNKTCF